MSQTYQCACGQHNIATARHCGRAGCQLPNPGLHAAKISDAAMALAHHELDGAIERPLPMEKH